MPLLNIVALYEHELQRSSPSCSTICFEFSVTYGKKSVLQGDLFVIGVSLRDSIFGIRWDLRSLLWSIDFEQQNSIMSGTQAFINDCWAQACR